MYAGLTELRKRVNVDRMPGAINEFRSGGGMKGELRSRCERRRAFLLNECRT
jgi:hypothetical protein